VARRVVVVQRVLPHYRIEFFQRLRHDLDGSGIDLHLVYGQPDAAGSQRDDTADLPWAERVTNRYLRVGRRTVCWQPVLEAASKADLVIVEQASRLLVNYPILVNAALGRYLVGVWGHGRNLDDRNGSVLSEYVKRRLLSSPDWWFAYTRSTVDYLLSSGVDRHRVTNVQNASDTDMLIAARSSLTDELRDGVRERLSLGEGPVCVALGSLYEARRLDFLVAAADRIYEQRSDFRLLVVGDGPSRMHIQREAKSRHWMRVVGACHGDELARLCSVGTLMLNPGLVGLNVLDSFALQLPMITCGLNSHSPEFDYLRPGVNGVVLAADASAADFAAAVVSLLSDPERLGGLRDGCDIAARRYTLDEMVSRFAGGVRSALGVGADENVSG